MSLNFSRKRDQTLLMFSFASSPCYTNTNTHTQPTLHIYNYIAPFFPTVSTSHRATPNTFCMILQAWVLLVGFHTSSNMLNPPTRAINLCLNQDDSLMWSWLQLCVLRHATEKEQGERTCVWAAAHCNTSSRCPSLVSPVPLHNFPQLCWGFVWQ